MDPLVITVITLLILVRIEVNLKRSDYQSKVGNPLREVRLMIQVWLESSHPLQLSQLDFSELCQTTQIMLQYSRLVIFILIAS